jgi:hypothetical protein
MPVGELTEEAKNDLAVIKMRAGLHKDRFYKANDSDKLPKFFQVILIIQILFILLIEQLFLDG